MTKTRFIIEMIPNKDYFDQATLYHYIARTHNSEGLGATSDKAQARKFISRKQADKICKQVQRHVTHDCKVIEA